MSCKGEACLAPTLGTDGGLEALRGLVRAYRRTQKASEFASRMPYSVRGVAALYYNDGMNRKVMKTYRMDEYDEVKENLRYWLSRPPEERLDAVDELSYEWHGDQRLQRTARIVQQAQD